MKRITVTSLLFMIVLVLGSVPAQAQDYLYPGYYVVSNPGIRLDGTWSHSYNTSTGFKHSVFSSTAYSGAEFSFFGTGATIVTRTGAGLADSILLCRDMTCATFNNATGSGTTISTPTLTEGFHSVRVSLGAAVTGAFWVDAILITGSTLPLSNVNILTIPTVQAVVNNLPTVQAVSVTNFPAVQVVNVTNMPTVQAVSVTNIPHVEVDNFPDPELSGGLLPGFYDDRHPSVLLSGSWSESVDGLRLNGTISDADSDSQIIVTVMSDGITFYLDALPSPQTLNICWDAAFPDGDCVEYILESGTAGTLKSSPVTVTFPYGIHRISLEKENDSSVLRFDGILVHDPAVTIWSVGDGDEQQAVSFDYSMTAGDVMSGIVGVAILFVVLIAFLFWYLRSKD